MSNNTFEHNPSHMLSEEEKTGTKQVWRVPRSQEHIEAHRMAQARQMDVGAIRAAQAYKRQFRAQEAERQREARAAQQARDERAYRIAQGLPVPVGPPHAVPAPAPLPPAPVVVAEAQLPTTLDGIVGELAAAQDKEAAARKGGKA